ncbi:hypothetical protein BD779DRAFT_1804742 [Infundibulicybe gibba]|nr:hypothetical protein BD779DRAFT_1804742 [Infundibulicybe gibba]
MVMNMVTVDLASYNTRIKGYMSMKLKKPSRFRDPSATHLFCELIVPSTSDTPIVIILDVLNQMHTPSERAELLCILTQNSARLPSNARILIMARPTADVPEILQNDHRVYQLISLYDEPGADLDVVMSNTADDLTAHRYQIILRHLNFLASALQGATSSPVMSIISTFLIHCSDGELTGLLGTARLISQEAPALNSLAFSSRMSNSMIFAPVQFIASLPISLQGTTAALNQVQYLPFIPTSSNP